MQMGQFSNIQLKTISYIPSYKGIFYIVVTYEIRVFFEGAEKEVFSSILKKTL
jgi:hypothetical protein